MVAIHLVEVLLKADAILSARYLLEASVHLPRRGTRWMATFEKLRKDPALKALWREWNPRKVDEAAASMNRAGLLSEPEIAAVYDLARTTEELAALNKLFAT